MASLVPPPAPVPSPAQDPSSSREEQGDDLTAARNQTEQEPKKPSAQILRHELKEATEALNRSASRLFISGVAAGLELGFSLLLMAHMQTLLNEGEFPLAIQEILLANCYAFGFVVVVIGRSELFTEQTSLAVMPVLNRQASIKELLRLWMLVYTGNLLGGAVIAGIAVAIGPPLGIMDASVLEHLGEKVLNHPNLVVFGSALLAGWLMGLLSWLVAAGRDTISQIVIVWLIATALGFLQLHHVVAGSVEVLAGMFVSETISLPHYLNFLFWCTLGNATGGPFFVALLKFAVAHPEPEAAT